MKKDSIFKMICSIMTVVLLTVIFLVHRKVVFMMDDLWYSTNLSTGEPLRGFRDIIESQIWHYQNWGGRSMTHGILQLTLMTGEFFADVLNTGMTVLLCWIICKIADEKNIFAFWGTLSLIIAFNANFKMSMFWQSGSVNYVYSTVWILCFVAVYLRQLQEEVRHLKGISFWIIPLGIMTGWSNENMGPSSFVLAVFMIYYCAKIQRKRVENWMVTGAAAAFLGSCVMILAPGNFVRKSFTEDETLAMTVYNRFLSMLQAGADFLFPTVIFTVLILLIFVVCLKEEMDIKIWILLGYAFLSYAAMILSPHYPDRATFGTMAALIIIVISMTGRILRKDRYLLRYFVIAYTSIWFYAICRLAQDLIAIS